MRCFPHGRLTPSAVLGVMVMLVVAACGESGDGGETTTDRSSGRDDEFVVEASNDGQLVYGHGLVFEVPAGWSEWGPEERGGASDTFEWAIQAPDGDGPFLPHVAVSAGTKEVPDSRFDEAPEVLTGVQSLNENFDVIEEGEVEVSGAERAYRMHIKGEQMAEPPGGGESALAEVETYIVFLDMPGGQFTTVRFHAPAGEFADSALQDIYDSLRVSEQTG